MNQEVAEKPSSIETLLLQQEEMFAERLADNKIVFKQECEFALQILERNDSALSTAKKNPKSLQNAIMNVAAIGISLNPALSRAYLVPRGGGICLDIGYRGFLWIAEDAGAILWGQSRLFRANDNYKNTGIDTAPLHEYDPFSDRGEIKGAYCVIKTPLGDYLTEEMSLEDLEKIRARSKAPNGAWKTDLEEMYRKCPTKRGFKTWPSVRSERVLKAIEVVNEHEGIDFDAEKEPAALPDYSQEKFDSLYKEWQARVKEGKDTPEDIKNKLQTVATLSDAQIERLNKLQGHVPVGGGK